MKVSECADSKKKIHVSDFYFPSYGHFSTKNFLFGFFTASKIKSENCFFIRFSTLRILHENGSKAGRIEVCISSLGTGPKNNTCIIFIKTWNKNYHMEYKIIYFTNLRKPMVLKTALLSS